MKLQNTRRPGLLPRPSKISSLQLSFQLLLKLLKAPEHNPPEAEGLRRFHIFRGVVHEDAVLGRQVKAVQEQPVHNGPVQGVRLENLREMRGGVLEVRISRACPENLDTSPGCARKNCVCQGQYTTEGKPGGAGRTQEGLRAFCQDDEQKKRKLLTKYGGGIIVLVGMENMIKECLRSDRNEK